MSEKNPNNSVSKKKLSKEELLAGKWDPEEETKNSDPRIKDPDELLLKLLALKKGIDPAKVLASTDATNGVSEEKENEEPEESSAAPIINSEDQASDQGVYEIDDSSPEKAFNLGDIQQKKWLALKEMYDRDMSRWKEYEQNVIHWRDKVLQIVQRLQNEMASAKGLKEETEALKSLVKTKDEEIAKMRKALSRYLKNKNLDI